MVAYWSVYGDFSPTLYSLLYFCKLLYMFRVVTPPIIRSTYNCNYSIWHSSNRLCYLLLSWRSSSKFTLTDHNCHRFFKTLSPQKHFVLQSTAPLQLKRFKVGRKMAIAESAPVLPNQKKKTVLQNRPIH